MEDFGTSSPALAYPDILLLYRIIVIFDSKLLAVFVLRATHKAPTRKVVLDVSLLLMPFQYNSKHHLVSFILN